MDSHIPTELKISNCCTELFLSHHLFICCVCNASIFFLIHCANAIALRRTTIICQTYYLIYYYGNFLLFSFFEGSGFSGYNELLVHSVDNMASNSGMRVRV